MKNNLHLIATIDKADTLENIILQLAIRRYDIGYGNAIVPAPLKAIDTSSVETYLSGRVEFDYNEKQRIRIPYITAFIFSCIKEKNDSYGLMWSISLS